MPNRKNASEKSPECEWTLDNTDDSYDTACGGKHLFIEGGPGQNEYKFCPYCGGMLTINTGGDVVVNMPA